MTRSHRFVSFLFSLAALSGLLMGLVGPSLLTARAAPHLQSPPPPLVISEFRARGSALGQDEFVEIYNPSVASVDIGNWFVNTSNSVGGLSLLAKVPAGTILESGQHYLIAAAGYDDSVTPDLIYPGGTTSSSISNDGGIALFAPSAPNVPVDAVGMSIGSEYKEGTPLPPLLENLDQSYERKLGGTSDSCIDTGDNLADFSLINPSQPQNKASPRSLCGVLAIDTTTNITNDSPAPSITGQSVTVAYTVAPIAGSGVPTGDVLVSDGTASCTGTVTSGQCSLILTNAGSRDLTATYLGDSNFNSSISTAVSHQVDKADTTTAITSDDPDPSKSGQSIVVQFTVSVNAPGSGSPTGNVVVSDGISSCTGKVSAGKCSLILTTQGLRTLTATYQGDPNFFTSVSAGVQHTVEPPPTPTSTSAPVSSLSVIINEIAWSGTNASANDEWMELHNTTSSAINLSGWRLRALDGEPNILLTGTIPARGYYLLERRENAVSDITADQIYSGALSDTGERLYLYNASNFIVDYANTYRSTWLAGSLTGDRSMERRAVVVDSLTAWVTNTGVVRNGKDANGDRINGTPKRQNWAYTVTLTPSPRPTVYPTRTLPPQPRPVINEFLPRAGFDWNQDGKVDVFDEYIEVVNLGPVNVNLRGWRLDDRADGGSNPYTLPDMTLKPGERALFFGLQTNILLSDGGDTVRLLSPAGVIFDAQTYPVVKTADQPWCRLPDLRGSWYPDCFPTPNLPNERRGQLPSLPPGTGLEQPLCRLADTLPEEFVLAECYGFGEDMWNSSYWDRLGWKGDRPVLQNGSKWETFIE